MLVFSAACVSSPRLFASTNRAASSRPAAGKATQASVQPIRPTVRLSEAMRIYSVCSTFRSHCHCNRSAPRLGSCSPPKQREPGQTSRDPAKRFDYQSLFLISWPGERDEPLVRIASDTEPFARAELNLSVRFQKFLRVCTTEFCCVSDELHSLGDVLFCSLPVKVKKPQFITSLNDSTELCLFI